jgi:lipoic acid synthetase
VERLQKHVRGRGNIRDTSAVLRRAKERGFFTKTSLMLGVGETREEMEGIIRHIAELKVDILTMGQYLSPGGPAHLPVSRFVPPEEFDSLRDYALAQGIRVCQSGPLVRSSYRADEAAAVLFTAAPI